MNAVLQRDGEPHTSGEVGGVHPLDHFDGVADRPDARQGLAVPGDRRHQVAGQDPVAGVQEVLPLHLGEMLLLVPAGNRQTLPGQPEVPAAPAAPDRGTPPRLAQLEAGALALERHPEEVADAALGSGEARGRVPEAAGAAVEAEHRRDRVPGHETDRTVAGVAGGRVPVPDGHVPADPARRAGEGDHQVEHVGAVQQQLLAAAAAVVLGSAPEAQQAAVFPGGDLADRPLHRRHGPPLVGDPDPEVVRLDRGEDGVDPGKASAAGFSR